MNQAHRISVFSTQLFLKAPHLLPADALPVERGVGELEHILQELRVLEDLGENDGVLLMVHDDQFLLVEGVVVTLQKEAFITVRCHLDEVSPMIKRIRIEVEVVQENLPYPHFLQISPLPQLLQKRHNHVDEAEALQSSPLRIRQAMSAKQLPCQEVERAKHGELF